MVEALHGAHLHKVCPFYVKCGVSEEDWPRLKALAEQDELLDNNVLTYLEKIFQEYEDSFHQSEAEMQDAIWRAAWHPLR
jgi:hypothetical protein